MKTKKELNKPIFIIGHARGGTTLMGAIVNLHSHVGPKYIKSDDLDAYKDYKKHIEFSEKLEQKEIWFKYFKGSDCFTHMGLEIYDDSVNLEQVVIDRLIEELTIDFEEKRFLSKTPTNTFRIKPLLEIFPDCKILVILRRGEDVVSSWGVRNYGFGKEVNWGKTKIKKLSYFRGINIFVRKWLEVIEVVSKESTHESIKIITYERLVKDTEDVLKETFSFLELPYESYLGNIKLSASKNKWKKNIPIIFQIYLMLKVYLGNKKISKLESSSIH